VAQGKIEGPQEEWYDFDLFTTTAMNTLYRQINGPGLQRYTEQTDKEHDEVTAVAVCIFLEPNATSRAASTTSFADAPAGKAIPAPRAFISRWKMT